MIGPKAGDRPTQTENHLHRGPRRDRAVVLLGIAGIAALAWAYTIHMASAAGGMGEMAMPRLQPWSATDFLLMSAMWAVMMVAMMLPSAAPMIGLYATVTRTRREPGSSVPPTALFTLAYLLVWSGFALAATLGNWLLHQGGLMSGMMGSTVPALGGVLLLLAGAFQWTRLKHACLSRCRSPLGFLMSEWREGNRGALVMGLRHGAYCVGCCWALMALLFVAGVMNLLWIALLAGIALAEKLMPGGAVLARGLGVLLISAGAWLLTTSLL